MDLPLSVAGGPGATDALPAVLDWLERDPGLRGRVRPLMRPPASDELGGVADGIQVALGAGGGLAVLASSLRVWFAQPRRSDVQLRIDDGAGRIVEVDAKR